MKKLSFEMILRVKRKGEEINLHLIELSPLSKDTLELFRIVNEYIPNKCPLCEEIFKKGDYLLLIYEDLGRFPTCAPHIGCIQNGSLLEHLNKIATRLASDGGK